MKLRYILIGLDFDFYAVANKELRYEFECYTGFISNYFSRAIRKYKFDTNGAFNMIYIIAQKRFKANQNIGSRCA